MAKTKVKKIKMKTHRTVAKRVKVTATGKLMRGQANRSHLNGKKTSKRKQRLDTMVEVSTANTAKLRLELPYPKYCR